MVMKVYSAEFEADAVALYLSDPKNTFDYERKAAHVLALASIACTLICYRRLAK